MLVNVFVDFGSKLVDRIEEFGFLCIINYDMWRMVCNIWELMGVLYYVVEIMLGYKVYIGV